MTFKIAPFMAAVLMLGGCAVSPPDDPQDPLEKANRVVFGFNRVVDKYALRPVANAYAIATPTPWQNGVSNFFNNLEEPRTLVSALLQGKGKVALNSTGRFVMNTTIGLVGLMDVASDVGLPRQVEDFGQVFGHYNIGQGWYLMLPFLGPSTNRDLTGRIPGFFTGVGAYTETAVSLPMTGVDLISTRANYLGADSIIENAIDPYIFVRTAYLQQRLAQVYDGNPPARLLYGDAE